VQYCKRNETETPPVKAEIPRLSFTSRACDLPKFLSATSGEFSHQSALIFLQRIHRTKLVVRNNTTLFSLDNSPSLKRIISRDKGIVKHSSRLVPSKMEPYYSKSLSQFKSTATVASAADLTAYASANGYSPPPAINLTTPPLEGSEKTCSNCGGSPQHRCTGCAEGVDRHGNHSPTFYCGKECQQEHWKATHKSDCKAANDRKVLYRAGAILQPVFEASRRFTWFDNILEADWDGEDEQRKLVVRFGKMITGRDFHKFQDDLLPDEQAKKALLVDGSGWEAVATMGNTVRLLLQGKSPRDSRMCFLLINSGTCDEAHIRENAVRVHGSVVTPIFPSEDEVNETKGDDNESIEGGPFHWFFRIKLADGELYALELCTAQFNSIPGEKPWACVAPLDEHLQRLPTSEDMSDGWQGMTLDLGRQRQTLEATPIKSSPEEFTAGVIGHDDLCSEAKKFAAARWEKAVLCWTIVHSADPGKVLRFPVAKFLHAFCTFVWPVELMEREARAHGALFIVNWIRKETWESMSGPDDYE